MDDTSFLNFLDGVWCGPWQATHTMGNTRYVGSSMHLSWSVSKPADEKMMLYIALIAVSLFPVY